MTELEESLAYDAMKAIADASTVLAAVVNAEGSKEARDAYRSGVCSPCVKLQAILSPEAMKRGKARHDQLAREAKAYCLCIRNDFPSENLN